MSAVEFWDSTPALVYERWKVFQQTEYRRDLYPAQIAHILANVNRDPQHTPEPFKFEDFMPTHSRSIRDLLESNTSTPASPVDPIEASKASMAEWKAYTTGKKLRVEKGVQ